MMYAKQYAYLQGHEIRPDVPAEHALMMVQPYGDREAPVIYTWVYTDYDGALKRGEAKPDLEGLFAEHNGMSAGDGWRPRGQEIRSMSVGDVVVVFYGLGAPAEYRAWFCDSWGWLEVTDPKTVERLARAASRKTITTVSLRKLLTERKEVAR